MIGALVFIGIIVALIVIAASSGFKPDALMTNGIPARGILLQVSPTATRLPSTGSGFQVQTYQLRTVLIDIEIAGMAPFVLSGPAIIPSNFARDVLPGATVDVRIDPKKRDRFMIVGPGIGVPGAALLVPQAQAAAQMPQRNP